MKLYNKKFEQAGYENIPEQADAQSETWVKHENGLTKEICITYRGQHDERWVAIRERRLNHKGQWETVAPDLDGIELDAINTFCNEKRFFERQEWSDELGKYKIK